LETIKIGDLLLDSQNILKRWTNYFGQLLNVHGILFLCESLA